MGNEMTFDEAWKKAVKGKKRQQSAIVNKKRGIPPAPDPTSAGRGVSQEIFEESLSEDNINNPQHYKQYTLEAIEGIKGSMSKEEFQGYLKGAALKYLWRYKYKQAPVEDLRKAKWYLNQLLKEVLNERPTISGPKS